MVVAKVSNCALGLEEGASPALVQGAGLAPSSKRNY